MRLINGRAAQRMSGDAIVSGLLEQSPHHARLKRLCVNYHRLPGCQYAGLPNAGPLGYQTIILHPCGGPAEPVGPVGPVGTCRALYGGVDRRDKFGLWRPYRIPSPASPYSLAAMKLTTFDSDCICLTILPTSSFGSLVSERRMR